MTLSLSLCFTLLLPALWAPSPEGSVVPAAAPLITRIHDLSQLLPTGSDRRHAVPLLPLLPVEGDEWGEDESFTMLEAMLVLLVDELHADELQYEGRQVMLLEDGRLLITAPEAVHADLERLAAYVRKSSRRTATVHLEWFVSKAGTPLSAGVEGLVSAEGLELLDERRITLTLGVPWIERNEQLTPLAQNWESDVANQAAAHQPHIQPLGLGLDLCLLLSPAGADAFVLRSTAGVQLLSSVEQRMLLPQETVVTTDGELRLAEERVIDLQRSTVATISGGARLAPGGRLEQAVDVGTAKGRSTSVLRITLESVEPAVPSLGLPTGSLLLTDVSAHTAGGGRVPRLTAADFMGRGMLEYHGYASGELEQTSLDFPVSEQRWGAELDGALEGMHMQDGAVWHEGSRLLTWAPQPVTEDYERALEAVLVASPSVVLDWGLEGRNGASLAAGRLTLLPGDEALVLAGQSFAAVMGAETEIAQGAVAQTPRVVQLFDGLSLAARMAGPDELQLSLSRSAVRSHSAEDLGRTMPGSLDRVVTDSVDLQRRLALDGQRHELARVGQGPDALLFWAQARRQDGAR